MKIMNSNKIGFGCASLMKITRRRERENLLAAAYDLGIRHFDVAPLNGFGSSLKPK